MSRWSPPAGGSGPPVAPDPGLRPDGGAALPLLLVIEHEDGAGLGRLTGPLSAAARLDVRRPVHGDHLPDDLAGTGHAGLVVLGGEMGALDDDVAPWLPATRGLLAQAVRTGLPALGICLGAQLLAVACGGRVERGDAGVEVGLTWLTPTLDALDDPLVSGMLTRLGSGPGQEFVAAQYHEDAVTELPADAVHLVSGERYPHQAFRLGPVAWGVQYHPEVSTHDFEAWVASGHGSLVGAGLDPAALIREVRAADEALEQLAAEHAEAFAAALLAHPATA
jgi:GMP synthase (glutamine-hydrolysing)